MLLLAVVATGCAGAIEGAYYDDSADTRGAETVGRQSPYFFVSAETIKDLEFDLSSVRPKVRTPPGVDSYLSPTSCLGDLGPIGAYGPLGSLGPVGSNTWNPSAWISAVGDWSFWSKWMENLGGPTSELGPLGPEGPLSPGAYFRTLPSVNDFSKQLLAGGVWGVLGPVGPLGPLGSLGPLGPVGPHGFGSDADGQWIDPSGVVQRFLTVPFGDGPPRRYELFENYTESFAKSFQGNDSSFMVCGEIYPREETDTYRFNSFDDQFVTVLVVPEKQLDHFNLRVKAGTRSIVSASYRYIEWIQLYVSGGTQLSATVSLGGSGQWLSKAYRLYVVGSTPWIKESDITGDHQVTYALEGDL